MPSNLNLDSLEAIAKAATPGPWLVGPICNYADVRDACQVVPATPNERGHITPIFQDGSRDECNHMVLRTDAAHIAAFNPATALELIAEVRAYRAEDADISRGLFEMVCSERDSFVARIRQLETALCAACNLADDYNLDGVSVTRRRDIDEDITELRKLVTP